MKKILLIVIIVASGITYADAQTSQGNLFFGGSVSFENYKAEDNLEDDNTSQFTFAPSVGYFVMNNLAVGLDLGLSTRKRDDGPGGDDKTFTFSAGPFVRYYKFTSNEKFAFIGEFGFGFAGQKYKPDGGNETKSSSFSLHLSPGFAYFFNEHWALDLELQGIAFSSSDPNKDNDDDKSTYFTFGVSSFNPSLGVRYFLK